MQTNLFAQKIAILIERRSCFVVFLGEKKGKKERRTLLKRGGFTKNRMKYEAKKGQK